MALWENVTEYVGDVSASNLLVGAAAVVLIPIVVPAVLAGVRPVAKTVLKGGMLLYDQVGAVVSGAGACVSDLVAEARAEVAASAAARSEAGMPPAASNAS